MRKNDKFIGICESYTFEGMGVVRYEGMPVFVRNMLMGEEGEIVVTKVLKNYAFGRCLTLLKKSEERVEPKCSIFKQCGGCQIQHMSMHAQQQFKKQRVQDCIQRIAKMDIQVNDVLSMKNPYNYRNKGQIPVGRVEDHVVCGFYRLHSNDIIDMEECVIQHPLINETAQKLKKLIQKYGIGEYFRHLLIRVGFVSHEIMVVFIVRNEKIPYMEDVVSELSKDENVKSIILNINQRQDNVILGNEEILLYGKPTITDKLDDLSFNISSKSFYQVNPVQTLVLYDKAVEFAGLSGNETVLDLYCGIGTISLFMAKHAKKVIGIEIVPEAIEDAKRNAKANQIENVEFYCSDAGAFAKELAMKNEHLDVICVDPPRKGCDALTLDSIIEMSPDRIVYVSCDPATLARDLKYLGEHGYDVKEVQPVDQFCHSFHVECVCLIVKK